MLRYTKHLRPGWNLLTWGVSSDFTVKLDRRIDGGEWRLRKVTFWTPHSETTGTVTWMSRNETVPWGGIEVWAPRSMVVSYTYMSGIPA